MKKFISGLVALLVSVAMVAPTLATSNGQNEDAYGQQVKAINQNLKKEVQSLKDQAKEKKQELHRPFVRRGINLRGDLTAIAGTSVPTTLTLKVSAISPGYNSKWAVTASTSVLIYPKKDAVVTVNIDSKTKLYRNFLGKTVLGEMTVGDSLKIVGRLNEDGTITASSVKDNSLELNHRWYRGVVQTIDAVARLFTLDTKSGSATTTYTVKTSADTKFNKAGVTTTVFADIKVGDKVSAAGLVNTGTKVINASAIRILPL